jgi:hypothetical protein
VAELFFCCERPYCTDPYSLYNSTDLARKLRQFWAHFSRKIVCCFWAIRNSPYNRLLALFRGVAISGRVVQQYGFGTKIEAKFSGAVLVLWGIFLGWKCVFVAVLYFPKAE